MIVNAIGGGVGEDGAARRLDRRDRLGDPHGRVAAVGRAAAKQQAAARLRPVVDHQHAHSGFRRRTRRRQAGGPGADDQNLAAPVARRGRRRRLPLRVDAAEAGHGADRRLENLPARPEEGLVIEAGGHEAREDVEEREEVAFGARHGVDRPRGERDALFEKRRSGARVRLAPAVARQVEEGVGLLDPMPADAARPMGLEAAADHGDAGAEQRRGERIAGVAAEDAAVESEGDRPGAVDRAAARQAMAHCALSLRSEALA